jgi:hypothetical protein
VSTASLVPHRDGAVHVLDDFGKLGRAYHEIDESEASFQIVVSPVQFSNPVHVVAFGTAKRWSRDLSEHEPRLCLCAGSHRFVARYVNERDLMRGGAAYNGDGRTSLRLAGISC